MSHPRSKLLYTIRVLLVLGVTTLVVLGGLALGQEGTPETDQQPRVGTAEGTGTASVEQPEPYSPYLDQHFAQNVYFGDTHFHSSLSVDSGLIGNDLSLDTAIRFSRGEEVRSNSGQRVQLNRPLDFLVLSDHSEYLGLAGLLTTADPRLLATDVGRRWYDAMQEGGDAAWTVAVGIVNEFQSGVPSYSDPEIERTVWDGVIDTATQYNNPGTFTVLNGFEWSSSPNGDNLHRVVVFRDGPDRVGQVMPYTAFESSDPEELWAYMAGYVETTGGDVLAIPHNGNVSNGAMFAETVNGRAMTRDYAERRARWEPLTEVTQMKGDGETHPFLSPNDEFSDFERWDTVNINGVPKEPEMLQYEYARSALQIGIRLEEELGVNPFRFGMIGSTDTHISLTTTREDNFFGKLPHLEPSAERSGEVFLRDTAGEPIIMAWQMQAAGVIAVWARENTREEIFDAMRRREVYATSGSRIRVRVFGGWDFAADDVWNSQRVEIGYQRGVPMGGALSDAPDGQAPGLVITAMRDPEGANLDRLQVIKGWLNADGTTEERIYDVACADDRAIVNRRAHVAGEVARCEREVGSTVEGATYANTIGDPLLTAFWEDPEFDPTQHAFYYVRVLEIPKPRWTAYDAARFGVEMSPEVPMTVQDRAYTSPIWYTP